MWINRGVLHQLAEITFTAQAFYELGVAYYAIDTSNLGLEEGDTLDVYANDFHAGSQAYDVLPAQLQSFSGEIEFSVTVIKANGTTRQGKRKAILEPIPTFSTFPRETADIHESRAYLFGLDAGPVPSNTPNLDMVKGINLALPSSVLPDPNPYVVNLPDGYNQLIDMTIFTLSDIIHPVIYRDGVAVDWVAREEYRTGNEDIGYTFYSPIVLDMKLGTLGKNLALQIGLVAMPQSNMTMAIEDESKGMAWFRLKEGQGELVTYQPSNDYYWGDNEGLYRGTWPSLVGKEFCAAIQNHYVSFMFANRLNSEGTAFLTPSMVTVGLFDATDAPMGIATNLQGLRVAYLNGQSICVVGGYIDPMALTQAPTAHFITITYLEWQ